MPQGCPGRPHRGRRLGGSWLLPARCVLLAAPCSVSPDTSYSKCVGALAMPCPHTSSPFHVITAPPRDETGTQVSSFYSYKDSEMQVQRDYVVCRRSHRDQEAESGFEPPVPRLSAAPHVLGGPSQELPRACWFWVCFQADLHAEQSLCTSTGPGTAVRR